MPATDSRPRLFNPGWGLWTFLGFALAFALLKLWPGGHPLAGADQVDACARARAAAAGLSPAPAAFVTGGPGAAGSARAQCELRFAPPDTSDPDAAATITVLVTTQTMLRRQGSRVSTAKWMEVTQSEARASNPAIEPVSGPWRSGFLAGSPSGQQLTLHVEDEGVLLMMMARHAPRAALLDWGRAMAATLRKPG